MNKKVLVIGLLIITLLFMTGCATTIPASNETVTTTPEIVVETTTPVPQATEVAAIVEKLNTTLHVVPVFGQCYFIPENRDDIGTWYFISPNGGELTITQMKEKCPPSFGVEADSNGGLWLYNIDSYLDNWAVICKFSDGVVTEKGIVQIDYTLPREFVMMPPM